LFGRLGFIGVVGLALVVIVTQSGGNAAQATISQSCPGGSDGSVTVAFVWPAPREGATETWLDLSLNDAFAQGTAQSYGPFDPAQTAYAVAGLPRDAKYHYRVQSASPDGWTTTAAGTLRTTCGQPAAPIGVIQKCVEGPEPGPVDDGVTALFSWRPGSPGDYWIDVTTGGDAFAAGSYAGHGPAPNDATTLEVAGLARDTHYWWRVNIRMSGGWLTSPPAAFTTLPCPRVG
jgi:hypothetical protein